jgi:Outer membrane protein beta-barrel domain
MRRLFIVGAAVAALLAPATAHAQSLNSEAGGFGGITFGNSSTFGSLTSSTFGGGVAIGLTPNLQAIGEGGRITDIKPPLFDLLGFTPIDLQVAAWYGEGGVRFLVPTHGAVHPYGEATAGFAHLNVNLSGVSGEPGEYINAALDFFNRTEPMLGVGAGILVQSGPLSLDFGYRYKQIMPGNTVASALNAGNDYHVNQARIGLAVRF